MTHRSSRELHVSLEAQETLEKLSPDALEKLDGDGADNDEFGRYTFSLALSWINAGGTEETYTEVVAASHLGQTYPRHSRLERDLARAFTKATEKHDPDYTTGALRERLGQLRERLERSDLQPSLRVACIAVVDKAIEVNTAGVDVSARDLSERAGVSRSTAANYLKGTRYDDTGEQTQGKFKEIGFVRHYQLQGFNKARRLHINLDYEPPSSVQSDHHMDTYVPPSMMCPSNDHLLWTAHGVGQTAYRVYSSLGAVSSSVADLMRATGLVRNTVTKHLGVLVDLGLVVEIEGKRKRYCLNMMPDLDHAIATTGAVEKQQAKRDQYTQDRQQRQAWIEDHPEDAHRAFDPPQRVRSDIDWVLEGNIWQQGLISLDRRFWRYNRAGLDHLESLQWDDQLEFHITNPPLEYREYRDPPQPQRTHPPVDPFAALQYPDHGGIDPFATPEEEHRAEDAGTDPSVLEPVSSLPDHGDEPPF